MDVLPFFRRKENESRASSPRWNTDEQIILSDFDGTPNQFWGLVGMFVDGFDDPPQHLETETAKETNQHEYHFKFDPDVVFERDKTLGSGSVAVVQVVRIRSTGIKVACKATAQGRQFEVLRQEADMLSTLNHRHIVRFIGSFETPDLKPDYGIVMSPVGDQDLGGFLKEVGESSSNHPTQSKWLKSWFTCLASALAYLHNRGIRHEDIKPSNIIHRGGRILFTDFSSSTAFKPEETTSTESWACGTRLYAAPEFLDKTQTHGARSDIFTLGCVFLEMLTVISGSSVKQLHEFCKPQAESAGKPFLYSNVLDHLNSWVLKMSDLMSIRIVWKEIVQPMLHEDRKQRPMARQTRQLLLTGPVPVILEHENSDCQCSGPILPVDPKQNPSK